MNEDQIKEMVEQANGETLLDPDFERTWTEQQITMLIKEEQSHVYAFRLHKYLGKEESMKANAQALADIRAGLKYLRRRQEELNGG